MSSPRRRSSIYTLIGVGTSLAVAAYVAGHLDWMLAWGSLASADPRWIAAGLAVFALNYLLRTLRLRLLLDNPVPQTRRLLGVMMLYGMFNYLMPAKSGEVSYVLLTHRYLGTPLSEGTATLVAARIFDFVIIALVLPVILVAFFAELPGWLSGVSAVYCILVIGSASVFRSYLRRRRAGDAAPETDGEERGRLRRMWRRVIEALSDIDRRGNYFVLWLLTAGIWLCVYTNFFCIVASLGFEPTFLEMIVVSVILVPLTLLPVQGVANIGTHEAGFVLALSMFGHSFDTAMTIAVTSHVVLFVFVLLWGATGALLLYGGPE